MRTRRVREPYLIMLFRQPTGLFLAAFDKNDHQIGEIQSGDWKITKGPQLRVYESLELRRMDEPKPKERTK